MIKAKDTECLCLRFLPYIYINKYLFNKVDIVSYTYNNDKKCLHFLIVKF